MWSPSCSPLINLLIVLDWTVKYCIVRAASCTCLKPQWQSQLAFDREVLSLKRNEFRNMFRLISILKCVFICFASSFPYPDPYVRTQLVIDEKVMKTKKTTTKKNTLDPVFNESFSFNVAPSSLKSVSVIASVWDYNSKGKDNFVGQVIMGKHLSGK